MVALWHPYLRNTKSPLKKDMFRRFYSWQSGVTGHAICLLVKEVGLATDEVSKP